MFTGLVLRRWLQLCAVGQRQRDLATTSKLQTSAVWSFGSNVHVSGWAVKNPPRTSRATAETSFATYATANTSLVRQGLERHRHARSMRKRRAAPNMPYVQGALGLHDPGNAYEPEPVNLPEELGVRKLAAGHYHSLAVTRNGAVWSWG